MRNWCNENAFTLVIGEYQLVILERTLYRGSPFVEIVYRPVCTARNFTEGRRPTASKAKYQMNGNCSLVVSKGTWLWSLYNQIPKDVV